MISERYFLNVQSAPIVGPLSENFSVPVTVSKDHILTEARKLHLRIPDNIRLDRFGRFVNSEHQTIISDLVDTGCMTSIRLHNGVDPNLVLAALISMVNHEKSTIFPEHWKLTTHELQFAFMAKSAMPRLDRVFAKNGYEIKPHYDFPSGSRDDVENNLNGIWEETNCKLLIMYGQQLITEQKKLLETTNVWAQNQNAGVIICSTETTPSADRFISDLCARDIHFFCITTDEPITYAVEEYNPLDPVPAPFKVTFENGQWHTSEIAKDELREIKDRNFCAPSFSHRPQMKTDPQEDELINRM